MGRRGSLMPVGSEGWPVWSDPTDELLLLKSLKKLMLVLIERGQNTQCITATPRHVAPYLRIAADHVHPFMETLFPDVCGLFQQDNAPCHKAEMVQEWFDDHNNKFEVLTWPPNSPDLNPIQHLWDVLDKQVQSSEAPPRNLQDLKDLLRTSWCQIPQHTFRDPVESMPRRVYISLTCMTFSPLPHIVETFGLQAFPFTSPLPVRRKE
ncbi:hypothetical protein QTP86_008668 [Hemibagrus guttatus]|nr:hypothetical protein QTP86_008668 [Hemibagrus guttatus]